MTQLHYLMPEQLPEKISNHCYILDIRDTDSYQAHHIKGSQLINDATLHDFMASADMDTPVVVCCYHGRSSIPAGEYFIQQGFDEVYSLEGGINGLLQSHPHLCT